MTLLDSLFISIFGICVVFLVLIGLSLLVRLQSSLITRFSKPKLSEALDQEAPSAEAVPSMPDPEPPAVCGEPDEASEIIISPVPGSVLELKVSIGDVVKHGDALILLETMKMEYEINASADGTVSQIFASSGMAVEAGTPLIVIQ